MDIFDETTFGLKSIWTNDKERQNAKLVILQAIAEATTLTAKDANAVLAELDHMLLTEKEEGKKRPDPAL